MTPIVVLGDTCLHVLVRSAATGPFSPGDVALAPGGSAAMVALQVAALGRPVSMIGVAGTDEWSARLRADLQAAGVACDRWVQVDGKTARVAVMVDGADADHRVVVDQGGVTTPGVAIVEAGWSPSPASLHYLPGFPSYDPLREALTRQGARIVCDLGFRPWLADPATARENIVRRAAGVELVVCSGQSFADGIARAVAEECLANGAGAIVVSLGSRGALAASGDRVHHVDAFHVPVVNTLGAGDALVAGLLVALGEGQPLAEACRYGQAVAAVAIGRLASPADADAVHELLAQEA